MNCSGPASPPEGALWSLCPLSSKLDVPPEWGQNEVSSASHKLIPRFFLLLLLLLLFLGMPAGMMSDFYHT